MNVPISCIDVVTLIVQRLQYAVHSNTVQPDPAPYATFVCRAKRGKKCGIYDARTWIMASSFVQAASRSRAISESCVDTVKNVCLDVRQVCSWIPAGVPW